MAEPASRERLQPALLDRLIDDAPDQPHESLDRQSLSNRQLREAVLRDLRWLLNTTNLETTRDLAGAPLAAASTLNFGIPGFAGSIATAAKVLDMQAGIAAAIRHFEPRIRPESLQVTARPSPEHETTTAIIFDVRGELWAQPVPQQIFLETAIDLETRVVAITEARARA